MPYGDGAPDMPVGPEHRDWLMHCWLEVGDQALMGADMDTAWAPNIDKPKNGFDVTLHFDSVGKAKAVFDALCEGGKIIMPFSATFWSPGYGALVDRFGVPWDGQHERTAARRLTACLWPGGAMRGAARLG